MRSHSAGILRDPALDVHNQPRRPEPASVGKITHHRKTAGLLSAASVCYDYKCRRGEVSERLKELASKASVGETLPWVQIPPSPPYFRLCFHTLTASLLNLYLFCPRHFQGCIVRPRVPH